MKTQQELMQAYWGPGGTVDMVKEYNAKHGCDVEPWKCVKHDNDIQDCTHPGFILQPSRYTFAITILYDDKCKEHRPVFVGDKIYCVTGNGEPWTVSSIAASAKPAAWDKWSWNPSEPKRTFKLNDMELPCPEKRNEGVFLTTICGNPFLFNTYQDCDEFKTKLITLLTAARDKE